MIRIRNTRFPANAPTVGAYYRVKVAGRFSSNSSSLVRPRLYLGSATLYDSGSVTVVNAGNRAWIVDLTFRITAVGASGNFISEGYCALPTTSTSGFLQNYVNLAGTIDTTGTLLLKASFTQSVSDPSNYANIQLMTLEKLA